MADVDIVEVIAEEIYKARNGHGCRAWNSLPNSHKEPYRLDARAALSALTAKGFAVVSREGVMADTMHQPKTLEMLRKEIASLQVIQAKMEQGEL